MLASETLGDSILKGKRSQLRLIHLPTVRSWVKAGMGLLQQFPNASPDLSSKQLYSLFLSNHLEEAGSAGSTYVTKWPPTDWPLQYRILEDLVIGNQGKSFMWLLWHRAIACNEWIARRSTHGVPTCVHCGETETESIEHLLLHCPRAKEIWSLFIDFWRSKTGETPCVSPNTLLLRAELVQFLPAFRTLVVHTLRGIWLHRNRLQFQHDVGMPVICAWREILKNFAASMASGLRHCGYKRHEWAPFGRWAEDQSFDWDSTLSSLLLDAKAILPGEQRDEN